MTPRDAATLVNLIGFIMGATLYAMLLVMVLRAPNSRKPASADRLLLITALLGLLWNTGALAAYGLGDLGLGQPHPILLAVSFTALGFLPAAVVHSVFDSVGSNRISAMAVRLVAYSMSAMAAALHFYSAASAGVVPSRLALLMLTVGFGVLIIPLAFLTRRQGVGSRAWWMMAVSVFAVSALHLSHHEGEQFSWPVELIGHHASLPLALAILYQDYRFALADIFLKRVLTMILLVGMASGVYMFVAAPLLSSTQSREPLSVGLMLGLWVATALIYPSLRRGVAWFVDKIILRRADYNNLRSEAARIAAASETPEELLECLCGLLALALTARRVFWIVAENDTEALSQSTDIESTPEADSEVVAISQSVSRRDRGTCVLVPTNEPPRYTLVIGELSGGRRLLSDDMALLDAMALVAARRIDALRVLHERCEQNLRQQQISKLAAESELRALRAQINPHFLFNALTTIGYLIQTAPDRALSTLMRLTGLLRSVLRSSEEFVSFGEEIRLVESYLDIERERFEERLRVTIDVQADIRSLRIPSLIIQPLVENAINHGIAPRLEGGEVIVSARIVSEGQSLEMLSVTVRDTGAGASRAEIERGRRLGIGLNNIEQRIRACYGEAGSLSVTSERGRGTRIEVRLPVALNEVSRIAEKRRA